MARTSIKPLRRSSRQVAPMLVLAALVAWPQIALWLPNPLYR